MAYDTVIMRQVGKKLVPVYDPNASEEQRSDESWRYRLVLGLRNALQYPHCVVSHLDTASLLWLSQKTFELKELIEREFQVRRG